MVIGAGEGYFPVSTKIGFPTGLNIITDGVEPPQGCTWAYDTNNKIIGVIVKADSEVQTINLTYTGNAVGAGTITYPDGSNEGYSFEADIPTNTTVTLSSQSITLIPQGTAYFPLNTIIKEPNNGLIQFNPNSSLPTGLAWVYDPVNPTQIVGVQVMANNVANVTIPMTGNAAGTGEILYPGQTTPATYIIPEYDPTAFAALNYGGLLIGADSNAYFPAGSIINFPNSGTVAFDTSKTLPAGLAWYPNASNPSGVQITTANSVKVANIPFTGNSNGAGTVTYPDGKSSTYNFVEIDPPVDASFVLIDPNPPYSGTLTLSPQGAVFPPGTVVQAGNANFDMNNLPEGVTAYSGPPIPGMPTNGLLIIELPVSDNRSLPLPLLDYSGKQSLSGLIAYPDGSIVSYQVASRSRDLMSELTPSESTEISSPKPAQALDMVARFLDTSPAALGFTPTPVFEGSVFAGNFAFNSEGLQDHLSIAFMSLVGFAYAHHHGASASVSKIASSVRESIGGAHTAYADEGVLGVVKYISKGARDFAYDLSKECARVGMLATLYMACGIVEPVTASLLGAATYMILKNAGPVVLPMFLKKLGLPSTAAGFVGAMVEQVKGMQEGLYAIADHFNGMAQDEYKAMKIEVAAEAIKASTAAVAYEALAPDEIPLSVSGEVTYGDFSSFTAASPSVMPGASLPGVAALVTKGLSSLAKAVNKGIQAPFLMHKEAVNAQAVNELSA